MPATPQSVRRELANHHDSLCTTQLRELFDNDPHRVDKFSLRKDDLLLDVSRNLVTAETWELLLRLARACDLEGARDAMFAGEIVNVTEEQPALHSALREPRGGTTVLGKRMQQSRKHMFEFVEALRRGTITSSAGPFTDVINIGIGGSALGVDMALQALRPWHDGPRVHVLCSVDPMATAEVLRSLNPQTTLVIVASKTFTTMETLSNATTVRNWLCNALGESQTAQHFVATTAAPAAAIQWGIAEDRIFTFDTAIGGRYSIWSATGLPVAIAIGKRRFQDFLAGGGCMDAHFQDAPLEKNLPVALGLIGLWNREFCGYQSRTIIPYDSRLARLPAYLQQLTMESNGKSTDNDGNTVTGPTSPTVWGESGTEAQHSFFQLLHQGTDPIPCEFLLAARSLDAQQQEHHEILVANCLAQCEALMRGRTLAETRAELYVNGEDSSAVARLAPHQVCSGNRPSTLIGYRHLEPFTLGHILSLYEHRVFIEATLWNINPFDQMGVELGKRIANILIPSLRGEADMTALPSSIAPTLSYFRSLIGNSNPK